MGALPSREVKLQNFNEIGNSTSEFQHSEHVLYDSTCSELRELNDEHENDSVTPILAT